MKIKNQNGDWRWEMGWEVKKRQCWRAVPRASRKARSRIGDVQSPRSKVQSQADQGGDEAEFEDLRLKTSFLSGEARQVGVAFMVLGAYLGKSAVDPDNAVGVHVGGAVHDDPVGLETSGVVLVPRSWTAAADREVPSKVRRFTCCAPGSGRLFTYCHRLPLVPAVFTKNIFRGVSRRLARDWLEEH